MWLEITWAGLTNWHVMAVNAMQISSCSARASLVRFRRACKGLNF